MIISENDLRDEMIDVCINTAKSESFFSTLDETFFAENSLLYLTINTAEKPSSVTIVGIEKGKKINIVVNCVAENVMAEMTSFTVLVVLPKSSVTGGEKITALVV